MRRRLDLAFVMDPIASIDPERDTTFVLMLEAGARGHGVHVCGIRDLYVRDARTWARVEPARVERAVPHYAVGAAADRPLASFDVVLMRKDPPYDLDYVYATHLLEPRVSGAFVTNAPHALREATEKLFVLRYPDLTPTTHLACDPARLKGWLAELGGRMVVKRLDGSGGAGVFLLRDDDPNLNAILEVATDFGRKTVVAQRYLPEGAAGDKRLIVIGGEPVGAVLRVPSGGDFRGNIHVGARTVHADVDERDRAICARLRPELDALGLDFVGLDVIGGWVTEVNVTSPTGFQEIRRLSGVELEKRLLDHLEARVASGTAPVA